MLQRYFKEDVRVYGTYLSYDRSAKSRKNLLTKYPESSKRGFQMEYLLEDYKNVAMSCPLEQMGAIKQIAWSEVYAFSCQVIGECSGSIHFTAWKAGHKPEKSVENKRR